VALQNKFNTGFSTFLPIYLFSFPAVGLYMPIHWPVLLFYFLLNHYLHCGYVLPLLEWILSPLMIMTSEWHNVHHEKGR
jgi:sterol desaturase/sphingolipid hydroxylase (fatty acid hydroxylase superfamily)